MHWINDTLFLHFVVDLELSFVEEGCVFWSLRQLDRLVLGHRDPSLCHLDLELIHHVAALLVLIAEELLKIIYCVD